MAEHSHESPIRIADLIPAVSIAGELLGIRRMHAPVVLARDTVAGPGEVEAGDEASVVEP